jgi:hypothetical protein
VNNEEFVYIAYYDTFYHVDSGYMFGGEYLLSAPDNDIIDSFYNATKIVIDSSLINKMRDNVRNIV